MSNHKILSIFDKLLHEYVSNYNEKDAKTQKKLNIKRENKM